MEIISWISLQFSCLPSPPFQTTNLGACFSLWNIQILSIDICLLFFICVIYILFPSPIWFLQTQLHTNNSQLYLETAPDTFVLKDWITLIWSRVKGKYMCFLISTTCKTQYPVTTLYIHISNGSNIFIYCGPEDFTYICKAFL